MLLRTDGAQLGGTNKIIINLDAEGGLLLRTAGHEVFHYLEQVNADAAQMLREFVGDIQKEIAAGNLVRIKNRSDQAGELSPPIGNSYGEIASTNSISRGQTESQEYLSGKSEAAKSDTKLSLKPANNVTDSPQFKRWFGNSSKSYYKVHRIIMPDGTQFSFAQKNRDIAERAGRNNTNSVLSPAANISTNSIPLRQAESQDKLSLKPASSISEENRRLIEENETYKTLIGKLNRQIAALQKKVVDPKGVRKLAKDVRAQYGADDAIRPADRKAGGRFVFLLRNNKPPA